MSQATLHIVPTAPAAMDPAKGGAVGYIVKYIAKNIDGHQIGDEGDLEAETAASEGARRVRAWASLWGLRQFQQLGGPSVSVGGSCGDYLGECKRVRGGRWPRSRARSWRSAAAMRTQRTGRSSPIPWAALCAHGMRDRCGYIT